MNLKEIKGHIYNNGMFFVSNDNLLYEKDTEGEWYPSKKLLNKVFMDNFDNMIVNDYEIVIIDENGELWYKPRATPEQSWRHSQFTGKGVIGSGSTILLMTKEDILKSIDHNVSGQIVSDDESGITNPSFKYKLPCIIKCNKQS